MADSDSVGKSRRISKSNVDINAVPKRRRVSKSTTVSKVGSPASSNRKVTLNFDSQVTSVDRIVNVTYSKWRCSQQFEISGEVCSKIMKDIDYIREKCLEEGATFATKENGLKACLDIAEIVIFGSDELGREVRKEFQWCRDIEDTIIAIVETFTPSKKCEIWEDMGPQIEEVYEKANEYCILEGFVDVINIFKGDDISDDAEDV